MREAFSEFWTDSGGSRSADAAPAVKKVKPLRRRYPRAICTRDGHSDSLINRMMDGGVSPGRVPPPPPGCISHKSSQEELCLTPECIEAAGSVLSKIDQSVNPCEDFYGFSCGGWLKDNPIPEDSSSFGIYPWLRQNVDLRLKVLLEAPSDPDELEAVTKAKILYRSCMNETILEKMDTKPMLKTLRLPEFRWPVVGDGLGGEYRWSAEEWSLLKTLTEMRNQHSKSVLVRLYVSPDDKISSQYIIKLDQASLTLPSREDYITNTSSARAYRAALLSWMVDTAVMLGAPEKAALTQMKEALDFETKVAHILIPYENRNSDTMYNKMSLSDLQSSIPQFDWLGFVKAVVESDADPVRSVASSEFVIVRAPQYFKDLFKLIDSTDSRTVANYVQWRSVLSRITTLSRRFLYRYLDFARHENVCGAAAASHTTSSSGPQRSRSDCGGELIDTNRY
ncbi:Metalloendopeptidase PEX [Liparis tanakae]|uniref:Metalloendopeptidase PEX n=1 Tax=Liparis tanakae TaxID=230148 RepID=A0A4Z2H665_9TELE|nr:Metalloendopeptidase PEX [Liparis tanakae]